MPDASSPAQIRDSDLTGFIGQGSKPDFDALTRQQGREAFGPFEQDQGSTGEEIV
jgi:hypothetical protein